MRALVVCLALAFGSAAAPAYADPPETHEIIYNRPSGFWTSNRPAVGGAYRYRLLLIGVAIVLGMGLLTYRVVRRTARTPRDVEDARRAGSPR
jgi:hypothetical protein